MASRLKFWVHTDKPNQTCTLHESDCVHVLNHKSDETKAAPDKKPDENWQGFETREQAEEWYTINFAGYGLIPCNGCF